MKNYYSYINESKTQYKFPGIYKIGDRVVLNVNTDGYGDLDNKTGTIIKEREILKPMSWTKKQIMEWADYYKDELCYQIKLDNPYKGWNSYYIQIPENCIKCLEKDKDEYLRKKEEIKLKMIESDPYGEEDW